jgi:hypothetical protein
VEEGRRETARSYGYFHNASGDGAEWKFQFKRSSERTSFCARRGAHQSGDKN